MQDPRWSHRPTWPGERQEEDRTVWLSVCVGRVHRVEYGCHACGWAWSYAGGGLDASGHTATLEEALQRVRERHRRSVERGEPGESG